MVAFRRHFWKLSDFLQAVELSVTWAIDTGNLYDFFCHPSCMLVEDPKFETVRLICRLAEQVGNRSEVVELDAIAAGVPRPNRQDLQTGE